MDYKTCVEAVVVTAIQRKISDVLKKHPALNSFGFGLSRDFENRRLSTEARQQRIRKGQQYLHDHAEEVVFVVDWLSGVEKTKQVNHSHSYALKHAAEKESPTGYISNGAFIAGAIIADFSFKQDGPNAYFNMSKKSLKRKESQGNEGEGADAIGLRRRDQKLSR